MYRIRFASYNIRLPPIAYIPTCGVEEVASISICAIPRHLTNTVFLRPMGIWPLRLGVYIGQHAAGDDLVPIGHLSFPLVIKLKLPNSRNPLQFQMLKLTAIQRIISSTTTIELQTGTNSLLGFYIDMSRVISFFLAGRHIFVVNGNSLLQFRCYWWAVTGLLTSPLVMMLRI